jgi:hypothetical protein
MQPLFDYLHRAGKRALTPHVHGKDPDPKEFSWHLKHGGQYPGHGGQYPGYVHFLESLREGGDVYALTPHFAAHLGNKPALTANEKNIENMEKVAEATHWPVIVFSLPDLGNEAAFSSKWVYLGKTRSAYARLPGTTTRGHVPLETWAYVPGAPRSNRALYKNIAKVLALPRGRPRVIEKRTASELAKYHFSVPKEYQEAVASLLMEAYESDDRAIYTQAKELAALVAE